MQASHLGSAGQEGPLDRTAGKELRLARVNLGYELNDVAEKLRIRRTYLEAIEDGRYEDLPGPAYAIGFLRSYALHLGLDADQMAKRFKMETEDLVQKPALDFPVPSEEGRMPKAWLILLVLVLAGLAYGGWQVFSDQGRITTELVPEVPDRLASLVTETPIEMAIPAPEGPLADGAALALVTPAEAEPSVSSSGAAPAKRQGESPSASSPEPQIELPAGAAEQSEIAIPSAPDAVGGGPSETALAGLEAASPAYVPEILGSSESDVRIVIKARGDSWVQIQGPGNELLLTRIMRDGDVFRVPNRTDLVLMTGNAGALEVWVDDELVPELGPLGVVRRDIALDPDRLLAASGTPE